MEAFSATLARSGELRPALALRTLRASALQQGTPYPSFAFYGNPLAELRLRPRAQA